jgi:endonuclease/exonuclease/phosphatase family metal-dependent hydrolase
MADLKSRIFDLVLGAALLAGMLASPPAAAGEPDLRLAIASYNVQFVMPELPFPADLVRDLPGQKPNVELRARAIGTALACFDVIALQETINDRRRAELLDQLDADGRHCGKPSRLPSGRMFATVAGPGLPDGSLLPLLDDELTLASRLPVVSIDRYAFHEAAGADALAAKGVLHARLAPGPGAPDRLDVFTTHLQAGDDRIEIRTRQIEELAHFVRGRAGGGGPVLVMGDFNLWGGDVDRADPRSEYNFLLGALDGAVAPRRFVDLWLAAHPQDPETASGTKPRVLPDRSVRPREKRIDFLLLAGANRALPLAVRRDFLPSEIVVDGAPIGNLSSEAAVLAEIALRRPAEDTSTATAAAASSQP